MSKETRQLPEVGKQLRRTFTVSRADINTEERTVPISFSSEAPVLRGFGFEILGHDPSEVDMARLQNAAPFLMDHNHKDQRGVVDSATVEQSRGQAVIRFSDSPDGEILFSDVRSGIRTKISVGYDITGFERMPDVEGEEIPSFRMSWAPFEISSVSVAADDSVGVCRSKYFELNPKESPPKTPPQETRKMSDQADPKKPTLNIVDERASARLEERKRSNEITELCERFKNPELARTAIDGDWPVESVRAKILEELPSSRKVEGQAADPEIGMSPKEIRQYSIVSAMRQLGNKQDLSGLEREMSDAVASKIGREAGGFFVPADVQRAKIIAGAERALNSSTATAGGYTVGTDVLPSIIELLRAKQVLSSLGATTLGGLVGNVAIPKATGGATAYWLSETEESTNSDQTFGQLGFTPKRLAAVTAYTKQLLAQSSIDVEAFVRNDLATVMALAKDLAGIDGTGGAQPLGIMRTTGVDASVTFGGAPTWTDVVAFETAVATANASAGSMNYLTTPSTRGKWKTTEAFSSTGITLWGRDQMVNGYSTEVTTAVPTNRVIFGDFSQLVIADWDGMDVVVDPYTLAKKGQVQIVVQMLTDMGLRHPESFSVSTDAGNQ